MKIKRAENEWLLIRETRHMTRDERASAPEADSVVPQESILSGLTVEELGAGIDRNDMLVRLLAEEGLPGGPGGSPRSTAIECSAAKRGPAPGC